MRGPMLGLGFLGLLATSVSAQPLTAESTNLSPPGVAPGTVFTFTHHFGLIGGKVVNSPTFELSTGVGDRGKVGLLYATSSNIGGNFNEWQPFVRLEGGTLAYNTAAKSLDVAMSVRRDLGALSWRGEGKGFSSGFGVGGPTLALGTGVLWSVNRYWSWSFDLNTVLLARNRGAIAETFEGLRPAWSLGTQFLIPYTPHSMAIYLTNANTRTLQGTSAGTGGFRIGFDFLVPLTAARWGAIFNPPPEP